MNIFKFEFKKIAKLLMIFGVVIVFIFVLFMSSLYPTFLDTKDEVIVLLNNFPDAFLVMFGINVDTIFSFNGFYSFIFLYIGLLFAILGAIIGVRLFGEEKYSHCEEFLFVKPRKKSNTYFIKLLVGICDILIINIVYMAVYLILMNIMEGAVVMNITLVCILLSPLLIQLIFFLLGITYVSIAKKVKSLNTPGVIIGLSGFLLTVVYSTLDKSWLNFISPLDYFGVAQVIEYDKYPISNIIYGLLLMTLLLVVSYHNYTTKDIRS